MIDVGLRWLQRVRAPCVSLLATCALLVPTGCGGTAQRDPPPVPLADHHTHIRTARAAALLDRIAVEVEGRPAPERPGTAQTAADLLVALDSAGVGRALVLSNAYLFGMPDLDVPTEQDAVAAENAWVAEQASRYPGRLVALCSVNPLRPYALEELARCAADVRFAGVKLHLTNSALDLRDPEHLKRLRDVVALLVEARLCLLVHLRTRRDDYGAEDARIFVDSLLSAAPELTVQVAHASGWGGYDSATHAALGVFAAALRDGRLAPDRITFDLGAVVFRPEAAGADTALTRAVREGNERLAARMREIGMERFVYATDWPSWPPVPDPRAGIAANVRLVRSALPLTPSELRMVFDNDRVFPPR